jgi:hypothetical protein
MHAYARRGDRALFSGVTGFQHRADLGPMFADRFAPLGGSVNTPPVYAAGDNHR